MGMKFTSKLNSTFMKQTKTYLIKLFHLYGEIDSALNISPGCKQSITSNVVTGRHNIPNRILLESVGKALLGQASMDIGSTDHLALQDLQDLQSVKDLFLVSVENRGGRGGTRKRSAPATATPPTSKVHHPSQLLLEWRYIHLVEVKFCEDSIISLKTSKQHHRDLCHDSPRGSAQVTLHTVLLGVGGVIYTPHFQAPLRAW
eukprot:1147492-Pelagomonas_calceolata.AAC.3